MRTLFYISEAKSALKDIIRSFDMFHYNQNSLKNTFLIMAPYISFDSLKNSLFNGIFWF